MGAVFFDTWAYAALGIAKDLGHSAAKSAQDWVESHDHPMVTSDYVLDETITLLHTYGGASAFIAFIEATVLTHDLAVIPIDSKRRAEAMKWFKRLAPDTPRLSFTDCTSFVLLEELEITSVFTADRHFSKAGPKVHRLIATERERLVFRPPVR